jgi:uncharacterized protein YndB with AHSA1/START domain
MTQDLIEREIRIEASPARVWAVLTEPALVNEWFSPGGPADIDLRPGGIMVLDHGQHGVFKTVIVAIEPLQKFSYIWASAHPGEVATSANSTLVEFTLVPDGDATLLKVAESGFDTLEIPAGREDASYASHSSGWDEVMGNLAKFAEREPARR